MKLITLAEISPTPGQLQAFLGCVAFLIGIVIGLLKLKKELMGKKAKPPNEVLGESHNTLAQRVGKLEGIVDKNRDEAEKQARVRSANLYSKMEEVRKQTSDHTESVRKELSEKIDAMPDRVVALLRNTGALER